MLKFKPFDLSKDYFTLMQIEARETLASLEEERLIGTRVEDTIYLPDGMVMCMKQISHAMYDHLNICELAKQVYSDDNIGNDSSIQEQQMKLSSALIKVLICVEILNCQTVAEIKG